MRSANHKTEAGSFGLTDAMSLSASIDAQNDNEILDEEVVWRE
jgi:hypothetical protein